MARVDVYTLTMEQYLALSRENQAPGVEDTLSRNKDEDAHDHIDWVLSIIGLFNIPEVSKEALDAKFMKDLTSTQDVPHTRKLKSGRGPPGYYTKTDNHLLCGERRQNLEELLAKHQEESARRGTEMEEGKSEQVKLVNVEHEESSFTKNLKNLHGISFLSDSQEENTMSNILRASVNVLPRNIFEYLELTNLSETEMLVEMVEDSVWSKRLCVIDKSTKALDPNKEPFGRCLDEYNWAFPKEIEQLADEYEIKIRGKGQVLEEMWTKCKRARCKDKDWWYDYWYEDEEKTALGSEDYNPPMVHTETFEINGLGNDKVDMVEVIGDVGGIMSLREDENNLKISAKSQISKQSSGSLLS
ncbi:hypothetical protein Tco_0465819 [Tanacetum coccineum]